MDLLKQILQKITVKFLVELSCPVCPLHDSCKDSSITFLRSVQGKILVE